MIRVLAAVTALLFTTNVVAFVPWQQQQHVMLASQQKMSARDDFFHTPHFQVMEEPMAAQDSSLDRMLECAHEGECSVEEMDRMIAGKLTPHLMLKYRCRCCWLFTP